MVGLADGFPSDRQSARSVDPGSGAGHPASDVVTLGEISLRVWRPGPAAGDESTAPVLLAFHGWTDGASDYCGLAARLDGRCWLVAPNAPGHGGRSWNGRPSFRLEEWRDEGVAVLDALDGLIGAHGPVTLLGHSLGALAAARAAAERPGAAVRVILEEPPRRPLRLQHQRRRQRAWMQRLQATDHAGRVALVAGLSAWDAGDYDTWAHGKKEFDLAGLDAPVVWGEPLLHTVRRVREPVVLLLGNQRATNVSARWARTFLRDAPAGSRVVRLDAGHNPRRDNPARFVDELWRAVSSDGA